jgi:3-phenylpropionate/trans-cinnamate dioxygenase ferredoxin reductase component
MRIQRLGTARNTARTPKHPSGAFAHPMGKRKIGMSTARKIVVIGGGPAGVAAALAAKQQDAAAEVMLVNDEQHEPYEKPPLSKAVLTGKVNAHDAPIAGPKGVAGSGVIFKPATPVQAIDRESHAIVTNADERIGYDALVLATGSINRVLPMFPVGRKGIYYLRTEAEARALKEHLHRSQSLIIIGGGVIGLEVAASAAELGVKTTVVELAPRILARGCDAETSALIHERHRARGVDIRVATAVIALRELPDGRLAVETKAGDTQAGETLEADLIVVGTGAAPDDRLAQAAGLAVQDGIIVDDHCRSNDPAIFAAGDCTRFPGPHGPVRLENWRHAQEHGAIAGRNAAGGDVAYNVAPSFWSEQFDMYIQGVGWQVLQPSVRVRRPLGGGATLLFELDGAHVTYALGINAQRDLAMARRLIERRIPVDANELADPGKPLAQMLKAKV